MNKEYLSFITQIMEDNLNFLLQNVKETSDEVIELVNDAIDYMIDFVKKPDAKTEMTRSCISAYVFHILYPQSEAIHIDLLTGNIPGCFTKLRMLLEGLIKSYEADTEYDKEISFWDKIHLLEETMRKNRTSISKLIREHGEEYHQLWGKLSNDWIHTSGLVEKIIEPLLSQSGKMPSSWSLYFPAGYSTGDLSALRELHKDIALFRNLLIANISNGS